jgi:hypothetical protein
VAREVNKGRFAEISRYLGQLIDQATVFQLGVCLRAPKSGIGICHLVQ